MRYCDHIANQTPDGLACVVCGMPLPKHWDCRDCEFVDVRTYADRQPRLVPGQPCHLHEGDA